MHLAVFRGTYIMTETGSQAWIFGDNGTDGAIISHPTADYQLDDFPSELRTRSTAYQTTYLASYYSHFSATVAGQCHREDRLLPDTKHGRWRSQDWHHGDVCECDTPILPRLYHCHSQLRSRELTKRAHFHRNVIWSPYRDVVWSPHCVHTFDSCRHNRWRCRWRCRRHRHPGYRSVVVLVEEGLPRPAPPGRHACR